MRTTFETPKNTYQILVTAVDRPGVLARICLVLHRFNINIEALSAVTGSGMDAATVAVSVSCERPRVELIAKRIVGLIDVYRAEVFRTRGASMVHRSPPSAPSRVARSGNGRGR